MSEPKKPEERKKKLDRREFLRNGAALAAGAFAASVPAVARAASESPDRRKISYPESDAYLVYDSRLCWGCQSCMFACSTAHYGEANPSLSRIQIIRDAPSFTKYPNDIVMSVCRQCVSPLCVQNCPTGAAHVDAKHGNVRVIDQEKCVGCEKCIESCPQRPHRTVWNQFIKKSSKCDLCINASYWSGKGGPGGEPACASICPSKALKLVGDTPEQEDTAGYDVDMAPPVPQWMRGPANNK